MRFDIQVHSKNSPCSNMNISKLLKKMKLLGFDFVFITDHNTTVFHKTNKHPEFLPGIEVMSAEGEILGLYVKDDIKKGLSPSETIDLIHEQGGLAIPSHPFDSSREHFKNLEGLKFDAFEVFNGRTFNKKYNELALKASRGLPKLAGSDSHFASEFGKCYNTSKFESPLKAIKKNSVEWHGSFNGFGGRVKTFLHRKGISLE